MTIQVTITNKDTREGHNIEVTPTYDSGSAESPTILAPGKSMETYVYQGKSFTIREKIVTSSESVDTTNRPYEDKYV